MTLSLRSRVWKPAYSDEEDDIVKDFLIPALENSIRYDRAAGFFSSTVLAVAARGITRLIKNNGRMRLITSVRLTEEDAESINKGMNEEEKLKQVLLRDFAEAETITNQSRLRALAWLIAKGLLEIKVAIPIGKNRRVLSSGPDKNELFHSKVGIFTDSSGDQISFSGSINESAMGWTTHNEQFHVHASWKDPDGHVKSDIDYFEKHWSNRTTRARVHSFPEAVRLKLISYAPKEPPYDEPEEKPIIPEPEIEELQNELVLLQFIRDAPLMANGEALAEAFATFKPRPHQLAVADAVTRAFPGRFLLADEVGLGKTIEAGLILKRLITTQRVRRCLILTPASILNQWQQELFEKFNLDFHRYDGHQLQDYHNQEKTVTGNPFNSVNLALASMNLMRRHERQTELFSAEPWDLIILDEAHHARRRNILWGDNVPNLLLRLMQELKDRTAGFLLLTATPMQLHLLELYDTLGLLGTKGQWATNEEAFVSFFDSLAALKRGTADYPFLFGMIREYYENGGSLDHDFAKEVQNRIGIASWKRIRELQNSPDPAKAIARLSPEETAFLQEYISRSTPLHSLMFRNSRSLFRRYREKGIPVEPFPERDVEDVFIDLKEPEERDLYEEIEEYVTHFYRKAEARNNLILKLVMQGFRRRLTSSLGAIRRSLINRLSTIEESGTLTAGLTDEDLDDPDVEVDLPSPREVLSEEADLVMEEVEFLRHFIIEVEEFRQDSKLERFLADLNHLLNRNERVIVFTQFTDTMDYVRDHLVTLYGLKVACYSGRGGEIFDPATKTWRQISKEDLKREFKRTSSRIKILLGTEALSEGLNLQAASAIVNYDMPWNPMRVEQRIGRIDRIGQTAPRVTVRNYFYRGTIEDQIYHVLGERHNLFREVVGETPAILAMIHEAIKEGVTIPEDERLAWINRKREELQQKFERLKQDRIILENMAVPTHHGGSEPDSPVTPDDLERFFIESPLTCRLFSKEGPELYRLSSPRMALVTFDPKMADERIESVSYLSYGSSLFGELMASLPKAEVIAQTSAHVMRVASQGARESAAYYCKTKARGIVEIATLQELSAIVVDKEELASFKEEELSGLKSSFSRRIEIELDREQAAIDAYEDGKLKNVRVECRQILDELVAIEKARRLAVFAFDDLTGVAEDGTVLKGLLDKRADRIPALIEASGVDVGRYALAPAIVAKYHGKGEEVLDGSKGPLIKKADALLLSFRFLREKIGKSRALPVLDVTIEGLL